MRGFIEVPSGVSQVRIKIANIIWYEAIDSESTSVSMVRDSLKVDLPVADVDERIECWQKDEITIYKECPKPFLYRNYYRRNRL